MDHVPSLAPPDRSAPLVMRLADSMAEVLLQLVDGGTITAEEMQDLVTAHLVAAPTLRDDPARNALLQQVLVRLHAHVPARGRA